MAERTCHNCVYSVCDPGLWLRLAWKGEPLVPRCANHPDSPGQLVDVTGVPCRNYQPKPRLPHGDGVRMIPLGDGYYAYVDAADYEWLSQWKWGLNSGYAVRHEKDTTIAMHRQIMQPPKGMVIDHIDHNKLNNCRANLRVCTRSQNMGNRRNNKTSFSRFKGVTRKKGTHKWYVECRCRGKRRLSKYFDSEAEAARAYDRAAVEWFKDFAKLNFPEEWPPQRRAEVYARRREQEKKEAKTRKEEGKKAKSKKPASRAKPRSRRARKRTTKPPRSTGHKSPATAPKPRPTGHEPRATTPKPRATPPRPARTTAKQATKKATTRAEAQRRRTDH